MVNELNKSLRRLTSVSMAAVMFAVLLGAVVPAAAAGGAKIVSVKGGVKVVPGPGQASVPAKAGMELGENAEIITGPGGEAMLSAGGGAVKIKPFSSIKISGLTSSGADKSTVLSVKRGGVTAKVDKMSKGSTFSVKTPSAVAGVRGTQFSVDVAKAAGPSATLTTVKGKVEIKKAKQAKWAAVKVGDRASKGDTLRTGPDGSCVMAWGKGNVVMIKSLSQITVNDFAGSDSAGGGSDDMLLSTGKAMVNAKKAAGGGSTFNVRTPSAVAGVRGTKFEVNVKGGDPTKSADVSGRLMDVKGKVEVQAKGTTAWKAASNNTAVKTGDTIRTGPGASCVMSWGKGNVVRITSLASVRVDMMNTSPATGSDDTEMYVASGKIFVKAKKIKGTASTFTVKTPTSVAGVRGTEFAVGVTKGNRTAAGEGNNAGGQGQGKAADSESKAGESGKGESKAYGQGGGGGGDTAKTGGNNNAGGGDANKGGGDDNKGGADNTGGNRTTAGENNNAGGQGQGNAADSESKAGESGQGESNAYGQGGGGGDDSKTEVVCMEGEVAVASSEGGEDVPVMQGEKLDMGSDGMPSDPEPVPAQEMAELKNEASLENSEYTAAAAEDYPQEKPAPTEIKVTEGQVEASSPDGGDKTLVDQGQKSEVTEGGQPGEVKEMTAEEKTEINSVTELDDKSNLEVGTTGEEAPTTVKVLEGEVSVETPTGDIIDVTAGMKAEIEGGGGDNQPAPQATPMSQDEIKEFKEQAAGMETVPTSQAPEKTEPGSGKTEKTEKTETTTTTPAKTETATTTTPEKTETTTTTETTATTEVTPEVPVDAGADALLNNVIDQTTDNIVDNVTIQNPAIDAAINAACPSGSCINVHVEF